MIASISKQDSFSQIRELTELEMRKKKIQTKINQLRKGLDNNTIY